MMAIASMSVMVAQMQESLNINGIDKMMHFSEVFESQCAVMANSTIQMKNVMMLI